MRSFRSPRPASEKAVGGTEIAAYDEFRPPHVEHLVFPSVPVRVRHLGRAHAAPAAMYRLFRPAGSLGRNLTIVLIDPDAGPGSW